MPHRQTPKTPTIMPREGIHANSPMDDRTVALMQIMEELGYPITPVSKTRTADEQAKLYAQGRTTPGSVVTEKSGLPGEESKHQTGDATDFAFLVDGQPSFSEDMPWETLGAAAKAVGLEWGGDWTSLVDRPHVQMASRAKFTPGSPAQAQTNPASVRIGNGSVAPPLPSALGAGTAEAGRRPGGNAVPAAGVEERTLIDQLLDAMGRRRGDVELPEGALDPGAGPVPTATAPPGAAPDGGERDVIAQVMEAMGRRRGGDVELPGPAAPAATTPMPAPAPAPALSPQAVPMAAAQAAAPAPAPAATPVAAAPPATPTAAPAPSSAQRQVVHVEGLGYLLLQDGQTIEQAIEAKRAGQSSNDPSRLGFVAGPKSVGIDPPPNWMDELPPEMAALVKGAIRAVPQLASIGTDLAPQTRIPKAALGLTVPPLMQFITNLMEGKPWDEGVPEEMALGAMGSGPRIVGSAMAGRGMKRTREALGTSENMSQLVRDYGKNFVEEVLPRRAIATQARATKEGVADIVDRAAEMTGDAKNLKWEARNLNKEAEDILKGVPNPTAGERALQESKRAEYLNVAEQARVADRAATVEHALGNTVENLRFRYAMEGAKGGPSAIVPGSGLASQLGTAAGLPTNAARVVGPAAAWGKGSPVRKLHAATRWARPLGIDPEQYGQILSNVMRARYATKQATGTDPFAALADLMTPADPSPRRRKPGKP